MFWLKISTFFALNFVLITTSNAIIQNSDRLDCVISNKKFTETQCKERNCIYDPIKDNSEIPYCYFDKSKLGYKLEENSLKTSETGFEALLKLKESAKATKFVQQLDELKVEVNYLTENILRFKIFDPKNKRYEVPTQTHFPLLQSGPKKIDTNNRKYNFNLDKTNFEFNIERKSTSTKIFDTSIGGLIFSDQFIQISSYLPSVNVYGLGENTHQSFRHNLNYKTWPIFTKDAAPENHEKNLYGQHPFYTVLEQNGNSHGILLLNSNAMEYTLMPSPAISFKTIGGILDFFVFVGDNPEHVIQLYTSLIGTTFMPSFWSLGFQICKYGYHNTSHVKSVVDRQIKQQIPYDVQFVDSDYKHISQDFTIDDKNFGSLPELIASTQSEHNLHWTPIIDPGIQGNDPNYKTFTDGDKQNVFIKWPKSVPMNDRHNPSGIDVSHDIMFGRVWPDGPVGFPDFLKNVTQNWWVNNFKHLYTDVKWKFNSLWIDMNEPVTFGNNLQCPKSRFDNIPIEIKPLWAHNIEQLSVGTLCMVAVQGESDQYIHYDVHSLYGLSMAVPSQRALHEITGKRGYVLSRSTFVSSGQYTGHWLGDNSSKWPHIKHSIIGMLEFNLFGIPYIGADICGFFGKPTPELCLRWQQLGAFYPFSRNHNENGQEFEQDPAVWADLGHPEVTEAARNALYMRYSLLPYLYTLFFKAHVLGNTVVRPLFHEYPLDNQTYDIDQQFMWGSNVLISPFLFENQTVVDAYLPQDVWYEPSGDFAKLNPKTGHVKLPDSRLHPPIHFRGGSIIPIGYKKAINTQMLREKAIQLEVFPKDKRANGELFWDSGDSLNSIEKNEHNFYSFQLLPNCTLTIEVKTKGYDSKSVHIVDKILVANTLNAKINAIIDNKNITQTIDSKDDYTVIPVNIDLNSGKLSQKWTISWKTSDNSCNLK